MLGNTQALVELCLKYLNTCPTNGLIDDCWLKQVGEIPRHND